MAHDALWLTMCVLIKYFSSASSLTFDLFQESSFEVLKIPLVIASGSDLVPQTMPLIIEMLDKG